MRRQPARPEIFLRGLVIIRPSYRDKISSSEMPVRHGFKNRGILYVEAGKQADEKASPTSKGNITSWRSAKGESAAAP